MNNYLSRGLKIQKQSQRGSITVGRVLGANGLGDGGIRDNGVGQGGAGEFRGGPLRSLRLCSEKIINHRDAEGAEINVSNYL